MIAPAAAPRSVPMSMCDPWLSFRVCIGSDSDRRRGGWLSFTMGTNGARRDSETPLTVLRATSFCHEAMLLGTLDGGATDRDPP